MARRLFRAGEPFFGNDMTTVEQILLKLGIDQSQIAPGLTDFRGKVNQACEGASKSFYSLGGEGRAFKKSWEKSATRRPFLERR